ncbi:MAG: MBL fold metallo-hydrolase [SAR324 cluster bacterium]|nr:MBL fold metallo-hydrolase [SAR324 cluster bacterium]
MEQSKQYNNGKFHNVQKINLWEGSKMWETFMEYTFGKRVDAVPTPPFPLQTIKGNEFYLDDTAAIHFARLGHSSLLLQIGGKVWLTDPVFSKRASPVQWMGPKRFHPVPIEINELPEIEGVIISHDHYDHLDHNSVRQLKDRAKLFLVPLGIGNILESWGVPAKKIVELDWWENVTLGDIEFISTPTRHFSGRGLWDGNTTLWTSWVIRTEKHSIYFSGDSGYFEGFKQIGEKYGPFDITFMENGAYNKNWPDVHMSPEETMQAFKDLKGKLLVPIHNGTFDLSLHSWYDPMERIMGLAKKENAQILIPTMGQIVDGMNPPSTIAWWKKYSSVTVNELVLNTP